MHQTLGSTFLVSWLVIVTGRVHKIPLTRVSNTSFIEEGRTENGSPVELLHAPATSYLKHRDNAFYVGNVMLGKGQEVSFMFDTGTNDIIVKEGTVVGSLKKGSSLPAPFRPDTSMNKRLAFSDGSYVKGPLGEEAVCLKDSKYLCGNATILLAEKTAGHALSDVLGIFGLGWPAHYGTNFVDIVKEKFEEPAITLALQPSDSYVSFGELKDLVVEAKAETGCWPAVVSGWWYWWLKGLSSQGYSYQQGYWSADVSLSAAGQSTDLWKQPGILVFQAVLAIFLLANLGIKWENTSSRLGCVCFAWTLAWRTLAFLALGNLVIYVSYNHWGDIWATMLLDSGTAGFVLLPAYQAKPFAEAWIGEHMDKCTWHGEDTSSLICECVLADVLGPIAGNIKGETVEFSAKELFHQYVGDHCFTGVQSTFLPVSPVLGDMFLRGVEVVRDISNDAVYVFPRSAYKAKKTFEDIGNAMVRTLTLGVSMWAMVLLATVLAIAIQWDYIPDQVPEQAPEKDAEKDAYRPLPDQ
mmetsp:Transcript_11861/g.21671  ORF Transcript_11861/g.21671 Transcript_11861/m.21671 type:complete len:524 (-) Transcript_11861:99-1670(-)